jgi:membrane-bound serine protease (ClpP class)
VTRSKPSRVRGALRAALIPALLALAVPCVAATDRPPTADQRRPVVDLIRIDGSINPAVAGFIEDALSTAHATDADALVIELDTPGGLMTSAERIVKDLLGSSVPVIVYVAPSGAKAASAGTFITIAANVAAMAPGTTIGAAHPVNETGGEIKGVMGTKVENVAASFAKSIARERGRNEKWVEQAVRHSVAIGENEALKRHVIDIVAPGLDALLAQASGSTVVVGGHPVVLKLKDALVLRQEMTLGQRVLNTLADPNIVYLLLMAGLLGLYFEFAHPGVFFPGVAGAICLLIALASFEILPVTLTGLLLIFIGVAMLIAEAFVTSYGVLGLGGVVALVLGSLLLVDTSRSDITVRHDVIYGAAGALAVIILATGFLALRERWRPAKTGQEGLVGEVGVVRSPVGPATVGMVLVHGELWHARGDEEIPAGTRVRVERVSGLEVKVQRSD